MLCMMFVLVEGFRRGGLLLSCVAVVMAIKAIIIAIVSVDVVIVVISSS